MTPAENEKAAIRELIYLKERAEHYEKLQQNAEKGTHADAPGWALVWRGFAREKRRQMDNIRLALPTREDILKGAA